MIFIMINGKMCNLVTCTKSSMRCYLCGATLKQFNNLDLVKHKEIDVSNLCYELSSLHVWIHFFEYLLHLGYKLDNKKWQARTTEEKTALENRKKQFKKSLKHRSSCGTFKRLWQFQYGSSIF